MSTPLGLCEASFAHTLMDDVDRMLAVLRNGLREMNLGDLIK